MGERYGSETVGDEAVSAHVPTQAASGGGLGGRRPGGGWAASLLSVGCLRVCVSPGVPLCVSLWVSLGRAGGRANRRQRRQGRVTDADPATDAHLATDADPATSAARATAPGATGTPLAGLDSVFPGDRPTPSGPSCPSLPGPRSIGGPRRPGTDGAQGVRRLLGLDVRSGRRAVLAHRVPVLVGESRWLSTLTQYCAGDDPRLEGQWSDTSSRPPGHPRRRPDPSRGADGGRTFRHHVSLGRSDDQNVQIIVALPPGVTLPAADSQDCAYHQPLAGDRPRRRSASGPHRAALPSGRAVRGPVRCLLGQHRCLWRPRRREHHRRARVGGIHHRSRSGRLVRRSRSPGGDRGHVPGGPGLRHRCRRPHLCRSTALEQRGRRVRGDRFTPGHPDGRQGRRREQPHRRLVVTTAP